MACRRLALTSWCVAAVTSVMLAQAPGGSAADIARALQEKYDGVRDFSASFVHTYEGGVLRKKTTESGSVLIKKPGKMRWEYIQPETKLFVSDGLKIYSYVPADKQVIVSSVPADDRATTAVLFLAGKGSLMRDFDVSFANGASGLGPTYNLKLVPRQKQQEYDWLIVGVDRTTYQIRSLVTGDAQGGRSTLTFSNLKENVGLADKVFTFKIPRGVDVISNGQAGD
ncbi:MAG: outer membrane lipoprotein chaperone LolA [Acidobacteria bacterium]|nr:outer membrane lipoprotein chaperone LolA [Acidobacteriota bacterium]